MHEDNCLFIALAQKSKSRVGSADNHPIDTMESEATTDTKLA